MHYTLGLITHEILRTVIVRNYVYSVSQLYGAVLALNCIRGRSVSTICAFRSASVSKQLICRDLTFFKSDVKIF